MEVITIEGTITLNNIESKFRVDNDYNNILSQWGATEERLAKSNHIVEQIQTQLIEIYGIVNQEEE